MVVVDGDVLPCEALNARHILEGGGNDNNLEHQSEDVKFLGKVSKKFHLNIKNVKIKTI